MDLTSTTTGAAATLQKRVKALLASTTTDLNRDVLLSSSAAARAALDLRLEELIKSAEKLVSTRESLTELNEDFRELDAAGTSLWNLAATLMREISPANRNHGQQNCNLGTTTTATGGGSNDARLMTLLHVRILAYYLLEAAQPPETRKTANILRLFNIAVKAVRMCMDHKQDKWAEKMIGRAAKHQGVIQKEDALLEDAANVHVMCEYFILRTLQAWKSGSLSMADYMYSQAKDNERFLSDPRLTERMTEALFEIGSDLLSTGSQAAAAEKWLQRSFDLINMVPPSYLSESGTEMRMALTHKLARACIKVATPESFEKARNIIHIMTDDWPTRLSVQLLKLDLVTAESPDNTKSYCDVLMNMIAICQLSATAYKTILGRIHALASRKDIKKACECLDMFISKRLISLDEQDLLEQAFVTRIWFIIQSNSYENEMVIQALKELLDTMTRNLQKPLSAKATHAAQILLWKVSDVMYAKTKYDVASQWCRVALHVIFDKSGELNHAKIARRIIQCSIRTKDFGTAMEVFNEMSPTAQNDPMCRFLMFQLGLRTGDGNLATVCLQSLCETPSTDRRLLYACAMDAQDVGNREIALQTLSRIVFTTEGSVDDVCHVPSLLRCHIRLVMAEMDSKKTQAERDQYVEQLCQIYERVLQHATRSKQQNRIAGTREVIFNILELSWFTKNGYNLGLRGLIEWPHLQVLRIFSTIRGLLDLFPEDLDPAVYAENSYHYILCDFLTASLSFELARSEDSVEQQLQHYLHARQYISSFRSRLPELPNRPEREMSDLRERMAVLLGYDFEAAIRLKSWNDLLLLVDEAVNMPLDPAWEVLGVMMDLILQSDAQGRLVLTVVQRLLDKMLMMKNRKLENISRFMRSLVQLSLMKDFNFAEEFLTQAVELARNAQRDDPYPPEELQWLVATTWNKAIDFTCAGDAENAQKFRVISLSLASILEDKSTLKFLQSKMLESEADVH